MSKKTILKIMSFFRSALFSTTSLVKNKHEFMRIRSKFIIVKNQMSEQHCKDFEEFLLRKTKIVSFLETD